MPDTPLRVPSRTTYPFFSTDMCVALNVAVNPSSHSFHMDISAPYCRWRDMCAVLDLVDNKGLIFRSALWVSCAILPSGRSTSGPCVILNLFIQVVSTFM